MSRSGSVMLSVNVQCGRLKECTSGMLRVEKAEVDLALAVWMKFKRHVMYASDQYTVFMISVKWSYECKTYE